MAHRHLDNRGSTVLLVISFFCLHAICHFVAITVMFSQTMYSVDEEAGPAQPVLVLSNPSSSDIMLQVSEEQGTATSETNIS